MSGWRNEPLSAVCEFINRGVSPKYLDNGGIAVLNQKCVRDHEVSHALGRRHDIAAKKVAPERFLRAGDVLVNSTGTGTLGRVAQLREPPPEPTTVDSHVTIVRPISGLFHPEFFGYALIAIEEQIQAGGEGCGGQTELSRSKLAEAYRVGFPVDLQEQRRIVAILDEAFEGIATAKANAEKNLRNARELFSLKLAVTLDIHDDAWVSTTVGEICTLKSGTTVPVAVEKASGDIPYVKVAEMTMPENANGITTSIRFIDRSDIKKTWLIPAGAVVFPKRGGSILTNKKRLTLVDICADLNIMSAIPSGKITPEFLYLFFLTVDMRKLGTGSSIPQINNYDIAPLPISFPASKVKQKELVELLGAIKDESEALADLYARKISALDELKKSLLHQAFSGQL